MTAATRTPHTTAAHASHAPLWAALHATATNPVAHVGGGHGGMGHVGVVATPTPRRQAADDRMERWVAAELDRMAGWPGGWGSGVEGWPVGTAWAAGSAWRYQLNQ